MNKIFKVIWSKSKQCYIVVSEIAKNKTGKKKIVVASILVALAMQSGMIADVMAADPPSAKLADAALAVGTNGVAIGSSAKSQSNQSVAIGYFSNAQAPSASPENPATAVGAGANANGAGTVALGLSANATGANAVALGGGSNGGKNKTEATAVETTAVGFNAKASNSRAAAIGSGAGASGSDSIAMGTSTVADSEKAIAIGANSKGTAIGATALGRDTEASGASATALGALASAKGSTATAVGMQASASGTDSVAVGKTASATNNRALAVGTNAKATGENSVAVGSGAGGSGALGFAGSLNSTAGVVNTIRTINYATTADGDNAVALGFYANAKNSGVAVGQNALAATGGVAIGKGVLEDTGNNLAGGVVMGQDSATLGPYSLAMGFNAFASGSTSMAVGHTVSAQGAYAVAMGRKVSATGTSTAIGHHATATNGGLAIGSQENDASNDRTTASAKGAIAIGKNTKATSEDAVAIGTNAEANRLYSVALGSGSTTATGATNQGSTTINGITYNFAGATGNPNMQVSVGNTGATRQIKNVAAGEVSATSTDAINGSQLYAVASAVKPLKYVSINSTATGTGSNVDNDGAQAPNSIAIGPSSTVTNQNSVALGNNAQSLSDDSIAIGRNAKAESGSVFTNTSRAIAIGSNSRVATNVVQGIAIGSGSLTDEGAVVTGDQSIAIGGNVKVDGHAAIAIGGDDARKAAGQQVSYTNTNDNEVTGTLQTAILNLTGYNLSNYKGTAASHAGVAYGTSALAGNAGVAIGTASDSMTRMNDKGQVVNNKPVTNAVAIGTGARANFDNSVAIGGGSNTDHYATKQVNAVIDGVEVKWSGGENISPGDVVSFGAKGFERQLKNVAPGEVSQTSTDAVNGSQIYSLARKVTNIMNGGSGSVVNVNATGEPLSKVVTGTGASKVEKYYRTVDVKDDGTLVTGAVAQTPTSLALVNVDQTDTNKQTQTPRILGNVANGVKDNDAVNVSQLNAAKVKYFSVNSSDAGNINNDGATGTDAIAIGPSAVSNAVGSVALGKDAKANGAFTVALGGGNWQFKGAQANGVGTTALGSNTKTQENINYQTAIGFGATTSAESALALGYNAAASAQNAIALGKGAFTSGQDSLAFGVNSEAKGGSALAMGPSAQANSNYVVSLGYQANNGATNNANGVSIGWAAGMQSNGSSNVGIGSGAGRQISGNNNVSIGNGAGNLASANLYTSDSIMLGSEARAINGTASKAVSSVIAIGKKASGGADSAIALGQGASSTNQNSIAIGTNSQATAYNGVAIGAYSVANTAGGVAGFNPNTSRTDTYSGLTGRALTSTTGAVAIGSDSQSRQLTGLAAGTQDTDAVNVAQLKSVNLAFKGNAGTGDVNLAAHPLTIQGNDNYITTSANGNTINISGKVQNITVTNGTATAANKGMADAQNVADAINNAVQSNAYKWKLTANGEATPETIAKDDTVDFSGDTNISVARNGKKITTSLKKDITVDSVKVNKSITTGSGSNQITLDGTSGAVTGRTFSGQSFAAGDNVLSNTTLQIGSTTNGNNVTITKDGLTSKAGSTTAKFGATGIDAGGQRITNVSSGGNVGTNAANITDVKNAVSDVTLKLDTNSKTGTVKLSDGSLKIVGANGIRTDLTGTNKDNLVIGLDSNTVNATTKGIGLSGDSGTMLRKFLKDGDADFKISGDGNLVTTVGSAAGVKVSVDSTKVKDLAVEAVTVSKANTVDNPITVTPIASTNSKDYAIGIDTTKLAAKTDLTYRANSAADANAKKISLSKGLNFVDGGSTVATVDNDGKVSFDLNTATKNQISTNTTNIATNTTDIAANKGNITKNTASIATNTAALARNISLGADTGTASSQSLSTADVAFNVKGATGDFISTNMNGNTVEISTTRATINSNATTGEASVTGNDGLATAKNVADAINKAADAAKAGAAWNITTNSSTTDKTAVKGGDTVDLVNGDNIEITQDGTDKKKITVATKKDITVDSVTANNKVTVGSGANKITLDGTDGSVTGKTFTGTTFTGTSFTGTSFTAGNTVINTNGLTNGTTAITGTGVTTDNVTVGGISIDKTTGINAGNNVISNVASGGTTLTNAANIGDVQNAVANLSQNLNITDGTHDGTVDLKNQKLNVAGANGVTATVNNQTITVGLDADTVNATTKGIGLTADTGSTGNKYLKDGDVSFAVTGDGSLVSTSATAAGVKVAVNSATITAGADGTVTGPTTDGVATAKNVADAINAAKKASKTEITANTGEATNATTGNVTLTSTTAADGHTIYDVKLNDKVTLGTGANAVTIDGTTGAITGKTATIGGVTVNGTANTIGGLSNTTWNGTAVSGRAATEDQLKAATGATTLKFTGDVATNTGSVNLKDDTFGIKGDGKYISTDVNGKNVNLTVSEAEVKKSAVAAVTVSTDTTDANNPLTVTPTTSADGTTKDYKVTIDGTKIANKTNLSYKANNGTAKQVSLADGLNFKNGTLTTASIDDAGVVKYDVNTASITAGTDGTITGPTTDGVATAQNVADAINAAKKASKTEITANTGEAANATTGNVTLTSSTAVDGHTIYDVKLNDKVTLGSGANAVTIDGTAGKATIGSSIVDGVNSTFTTGGANAVKLDGAAGTIKTGTVTVTGGTTNDITGLSNTTVTSADFATKGRAATEEQLKAVGEQTWQITADKDATTSGAQTGTKKDAKVGKNDKVQLIAGENMTVNQNERDFTFTLNKDLVKMNSATFEATGGKTTVIKGDSIVQTDGANVNTSNATSNTITDGTNTSTITAGKAQIGTVGIDGVVSKISTGGTNAVVVNGADGTIKTGNVTVTGGTTNDITGLSNTTVTAADFATKGRAATEEQLKAATGATTLKFTGDVATNTGSVNLKDDTFGIKGDNKYISTDVNGKNVNLTVSEAEVKKSAVAAVTVSTDTTDANNPLTVTPTTSADGTTKDYKVTIDGTKIANKTNLSYKANDGTPKQVSLADGLNFKNGTLTTASIDDNGVVKYDVNTASITAGADGTITGPTTDGVATAQNVADAINAAKKASKTEVTANTGEAANATTGNVTLTSTTAADGHTIYDVKLNDKVTLGSGANAVTIDGTAGKATIGSSVINGVNNTFTTGGAKAVTLDGATGTITGTTANIGGVTVNGTANTIGGLSNTTWNGTATTGRAATEDQLKVVADAAGSQTWEITADKDAATSGAQTGTKKNAKVGKDDKVQLIAGENLTVNQNERDFTYSLNKDLVKMNSATFEATGGKTTVIKGDSIVQTDGANVNTSNATSNTITDGTNTSTITAGKAQIGTVGIDGVVSKISTGGTNAVVVNGADGTIKTGNVTVTGGTTNDITGLSNTTVTAADFATKGRAATEEQLKAATGATTLKFTGDVATNTGSVNLKDDTFGIKGDGKYISTDVNGKNVNLTISEAEVKKSAVAAVTVSADTTDANNPLTVTPTTSADGTTKDYKVTIDGTKIANKTNLSYKANDGTAKQVSLADGLNFKNGTLTTASIDDNGVVKYDVNTASITAGADGTITGPTTDGVATAQNVADAINAAKKASKTEITANTGEAANATTGNVTLTSSTAVDGHTIYDVKLNDKVTLGSGANAVTIDGTAGKATIGSSIVDGVNNTFTTGGASPVTLNGATGTITGKTANIGGVTIDGTNNHVMGLANKDWTPGVTQAVSGRAATEDQLQKVSDAVGAGWKVNTGKVTGSTGESNGAASTKVASGEEVQFQAGNNLIVDQNGKTVAYSLSKALKDLESATFNGTGTNKTVITGDSITQTAGTQMNTSTAGGNTVADGTKSTETTAAGQVIKDGAKSNKSTVDNNVIDDGNGNVNTSNATSNTITDGTNTTATTSSSVTVKDNAGNSTVITKDNITTGVGGNKITLDGTAGKATVGASVIDGVNNTFTTGGANAVKLDGVAGTIKTGTVTVTGGTTNDITGLSNTTVTAADFATKGRAATEEQLKAVGEQTWQITADKDATTSGAQTGTKKDAKVGKDDKVQLIAGENMTVNQNERDFTFTLNKDLVKMNSATFLGTGTNKTVITGDSITQTAGTQTNTSTAAGNTVADGTKSTETTAAGQVIKDGAKSNKSTVSSNVIDDGNGNVNTSNATSNIITDGTNTSTITAGKATIGSSIVDGVNNTFTTGGANAVKLDGVAGTIKTGTVTITGGTTNDITGLSNTTVTAADFATKGRAATEEQLKAVGEQTWQITADKDTTTSGAQTGTKKNAKVGKDDKVQLIAGENLTVNQNERDFTYSLNKDLVKMNSATFEATGGRTTVIKGDSIVQTDGTKVNISTAGGSTVADGTKSTETTADGQVIKDGAKSNKSTVDSNVIDDGNGNVNTSNATSNTITDGTNTSTVTAGKAQIGTVGIDGVASKITTGGANAVVINGADGTVKTGTVTVIGGTTNDITGLSNTTVTAADFATKGRAATEEQLKAVGEQTWQITADKDATTSGVQTGTKKDAKVGKDDKVQLIAGENLTVNQNERDFTYSLNKDLVKMNSATFEATGGKTTVIKGDSIVQTDGTKVNTSTAAGNTVVDGAKSTATTADGTTVTTANGNTNYAADGVRINTTGKTPVSLTDAGLDNGNNVIKNVASGHVNNDATDNTNAANIADVKKATTTVTANAGEAANATKGNVTLTSTTAADGHTIYDVKLNDKVTLGTGANAVTIDGTAGKATVGSSVIDGVNNTFTTGGANAVKLDGAAGTIKTGTVTVTGGTTNDITGLSNTTVNSADFATKGRAATEEQLKAVGEQTWQITADKDTATSGAQTGTKKDAKVGKDDKVQLIAGENMTVNQNERDFTFTLNKDLVKMNSATFLGTGTNTTVITGDSITQTAGTQTNTSTAAGNTIANGTKSTETTADGQVIKDGTKTNTSTVDENTLVDGAKSNKATVDSNVVDDGNGNVNTSNATSNTITDGTNRSTITAGKATIGSSVIDGVNNTFITGGANAVKLDGAAGTIKTGTVTVTGGTTNDITGLSNTTVTSADFATKGRAATEEQLKAVGEQTWQITADKDATTSGAQTGTKKDAKVGKDDKVQLIAGENMTVNQNERDFTFTLNKDLVKMNSATFLGTGSNTTVITGNSITQTAGTQTNTSTAGGNTVADGTKSTKTTADGQVIKDGTKSNKSTVDNNVIDDGNGNVNTSNATSNTITDGTNTTATTSSSVTVKDNAGNSTVITKDNVTTGVGANKIILDGTAGKATIGSSVVDGVNNTFTTGGTNAVTLDGGAGTIKTGTVTVTGGTTNDITGLSNTTVNSADFATKGRAATEEQLKAVGEQTWQITADKDTATSGAQTGTKKDAKVGKDNKVQLIAGENMTINQNERDFTFTLNKDLVKMNSATFLGTGSNTTVITGNSITQTAGTQTNTSTAGGNTVADGTKSTETTAAGQVIKDGAKTNKSTVDTNVIDDGNGNKNISNATSNTITDGTNTSTITAGKANIGNITVDGVNNKITMGNGANPVTLDGANGHLDGLTNTTWVPGVTKATTGRAATEDQLQQVSDAVGAGWKVNTGTVAGSSGVSNGAASTKVSSGEEVKLQAGDNLVIDQNGKTVSYSLNKDLTKMNSATFEATGGKTTVIKGDSIIQTDGGKTNTSTAAGNTVVDGNKSTATTAAGTTITDGAKTNTSTADKNVINDGVGNTNTSTATSNTLKNAAGDETKADAKGVTVKDAAGNNATFNKDGITITKTGKDTVSLTSNGLDNGNNKIVNVAAGVANTDAVNVGQLKEYAAKSTTELTANGGQPAGSTTGNIVLTKTTAADGHTIYDNKLNDKITLGTDPTKAVTVDGTTGTVTGLTNKTWTPGSIVSGRAATEDQLKEAVADSGWKAAVDKEGSGQSTVVGTSPEKIKAEETVTFKAGNNMMVTQTGKSISYAVNPELTDMKSATFKDAAGNTTVTNGNGITITPGSANPTNPHAGPVSLTKDGLNNGNNQIKGVAPGTDPTDAVNVSQLNASNANTSQAINQIAGEVQHVGAHAAAMAALKPIQYDPLEPTQVMAGVGNYRGETAAALGLAHYTNENTMFNVGVSVGGNHNMVNAGVTHKFGYSPEKKNIPDRYKAGPISSVYVMQDEVSSLKKENAEQKYVIADQAARLTTLEAENEQQRRELAETKKGLDDLKAAVDKLLASKG